MILCCLRSFLIVEWNEREGLRWGDEEILKSRKNIIAAPWMSKATLYSMMITYTRWAILQNINRGEVLLRSWHQMILQLVNPGSWCFHIASIRLVEPIGLRSACLTEIGIVIIYMPHTACLTKTAILSTVLILYYTVCGPYWLLYNSP